MKRKCSFGQKNLLAYFLQELSLDKSREMESHLRTCRECQEELALLEAIKETSQEIKGEIEREVARVDWEEVARAIGQRIDQISARQTRGIWSWPSWLRWSTVATTLLGLLLGLFGYHYLLRPLLNSEKEKTIVYYVPSSLLEKIDEAMATKEILDYLEKSHLIFLTLKQATEDDWAKEMVPSTKKKIIELLRQKRYFAPHLDSFRLAKAKQILEEIDSLLFELALIAEGSNHQENREVAKLLEEKQLILKIQLLQQELAEDEGRS